MELRGPCSAVGPQRRLLPAGPAVGRDGRREVHQDLHRLGQPTQTLVFRDQLSGADGFLGGGVKEKGVRDSV